MTYYTGRQGMGQRASLAKADMAAHTSAAYQAHKDFFDTDRHHNMCELAKRLGKELTKVYNNLYEEERVDAVGPFTRVKFDKVEFKPGMRDKLNKALLAAGFNIEDIGYRQASESYFVKVR